MRKREISRYLFAVLLLAVSFFLVTFEYFHTEVDFSSENKCPICLFERSATLFWELNTFLLIFSSLLLIIIRIFPKGKEVRRVNFSRILGQRAPPQPC
jgi:hypothetical protein